jgi:hypothetical protein
MSNSGAKRLKLSGALGLLKIVDYVYDVRKNEIFLMNADKKSAL